MIHKISRGQIVFEFEGKKVTIEGEALLPGHGSPDFVLYADSIVTWDAPDDDIPIDGKTREKLINALIEEMKSRKMTIDIE